MAANMFVVANRLTPQEIAMFFHKDLRRIVSIHTVMFQKLLLEEEGLPLELAALFEDVGNRYLDISKRISELHRPRAKVTG
jgi:hypothetical protein